MRSGTGVWYLCLPQHCGIAMMICGSDVWRLWQRGDEEGASSCTSVKMLLFSNKQEGVPQASCLSCCSLDAHTDGTLT